MFRGATKVTVDDKGRVVVPAQHREQLSSPANGRVVVTVDRDPCLRIYAFPEWEKIEAQLNAMPSLHPQGAPPAAADDRPRAGNDRRQPWPPRAHAELREYATSARAAFLVGQGRGLELWDEARWKLERDQWTKSEQGVTELATELSGLQL